MLFAVAVLHAAAESPVVMLGRVSIMVPGHLSNMSDNEVQALLDQLLCWLWCVHDIDYYAGKELALLADLQDRADVGRTLRPDAEDAAGCCAVAGRCSDRVGQCSTPLML